MFSEEELSDLREMQEEQLNGQVRFYRVTQGNDVVDPVTLVIESPDAEEETLFVGPMKIEATTRNYERSHTVGEARLTTRTHNLRVPLAGTEGIQINDWIEILEAHDPAFNGHRMVVIDLPTTSTPTIRFFIVEDILNDNEAGDL